MYFPLTARVTLRLALAVLSISAILAVGNRPQTVYAQAPEFVCSDGEYTVLLRYDIGYGEGDYRLNVYRISSSECNALQALSDLYFDGSMHPWYEYVPPREGCDPYRYNHANFCAEQWVEGERLRDSYPKEPTIVPCEQTIEPCSLPKYLNGNTGDPLVAKKIDFVYFWDVYTLKIELNALGLSGEIPINLLLKFPKLQELFLEENNFTGSIPPQLGTLSDLKNVRLNDNQLSGNIPATLANLAKLFIINLGSNNLSGPVPAELSDLSSLLYLMIYNNPLTGALPESFVNLPLELLSFRYTCVTVPETQQFQAWLQGIETVSTNEGRPHPDCGALIVNSVKDDKGDANLDDNVCATGGTIVRDPNQPDQTEPECTLRAAMEQAERKPGADTITFDIPAHLGSAIQLQNALPLLTQPLTIDGTPPAGVAMLDQGAEDQTGAISGCQALAKRIQILGQSTMDGLVSTTNLKIKNLILSKFKRGVVGSDIAADEIIAVIESTLIEMKQAGIDFTGSQLEVVCNEIVNSAEPLRVKLVNPLQNAPCKVMVDKNQFNAVPRGNASTIDLAANCAGEVIYSNNLANSATYGLKLVGAATTSGKYSILNNNFATENGVNVDLSGQFTLAASDNQSQGQNQWTLAAEVDSTATFENNTSTCQNNGKMTYDAQLAQNVALALAVTGETGCSSAAKVGGSGRLDFTMSGWRITGVPGTEIGVSLEIANQGNSNLLIDDMRSLGADAGMYVKGPLGSGNFRLDIQGSTFQGKTKASGLFQIGTDFLAVAAGTQAVTANSPLVTIDRTTFTGAQVGLEVDNSKTVSITNSSITTNTLDGLVIKNGSVVFVDGMEISYNGTAVGAASSTWPASPLANTGAGLRVSGGSVVSVTHSTILDNGTGIYIADTSGAKLTGNTIAGNTIGVYLSQSSQSELSGNTIADNGEAGVALEEGHAFLSADLILLHNSLSGNGNDVVTVPKNHGNPLFLPALWSE
jgi:parallel beta-helix repeat protein